MTNEEAIALLKKATMFEPKLENKDYPEAFDLAIKAIEKNPALNLLIDWAIQCDFGYDNFPEEYEKYADEIENLGYKEGMIYIARKEVNHEIN